MDTSDSQQNQKNAYLDLALGLAVRASLQDSQTYGVWVVSEEVAGGPIEDRPPKSTLLFTVRDGIAHPCVTEPTEYV